MQLEPPGRAPVLRARLAGAACALLAAAGGASVAAAQSEATAPPPAPPDSAGVPVARPAAAPRWQLETSALLYGERARTNVVEPNARITRLFGGSATLSAQLGLDVITGATPTGAVPSGALQTTTTASGNVTTQIAGQIPTHKFKDGRGVVDLEWAQPFLRVFTSTLGTHFSREKDYQSAGASAKLSVETMQRLTTFTVGASRDNDEVFPVGGTPEGLVDAGGPTVYVHDPKRVTAGMAGVSRILTRRWLAGVNVTRTVEKGYLTEPYKVVSLLDATGTPVGALTEKRPSTRTRDALLASSVYHFERNVLYSSYRFYRDDWGVRSHTLDLRYRVELEHGSYLVPHVRLYTQTAADFFGFGIPIDGPLPAYASSDYRLGALRTATLGATYGWRPPGSPGEITIRAEYLRQWGKGPRRSVAAVPVEGEGDNGGGPTSFSLFPPLDIGSVLVGYTVSF